MMFLVECSLRVSLLLALAFALSLVLRRQTATLRHLIWLVAFAITLITPLLMLSGPRLIPVAPLQPQAVAIRPVQPITTAAAPAHRAVLPISFPDPFLILWTAGALAFAIRLSIATRRTRRLRTHAILVDTTMIAASAHLPPAVLAGVNIAESDSVAVPMTLGVWAPMIVMPSRYCDWDAVRLRSVLLHELAHVRRRDCLTQWLTQAVCVLHWFNPLIWIAHSRIRCESERASDDAVLQSGTSGDEYAAHLLHIAQTAPLKGNYPMSLAFTSELERRIVRLLDAKTNRKPLTAGRAAAACLTVVALLAPVAAIRAQETAAAGSLAGVVTDPSGAVVAGAKVIAYGSAGLKETTSNAIGAWSFSDLPVGQYSLTVQVPGFVSFARAGLNVGASRTMRVDSPLTVGMARESVDVVAQGTPRAQAATASNIPKRIRVGGNVQAAKLISKTLPVYPESARQQGTEGAVTLRAIIGRTGIILDAYVVGKQVPDDLGQAALDAVRTWQYQPTLLNGEPVEIITEITVNFRLQ